MVWVEVVRFTKLSVHAKSLFDLYQGGITEPSFQTVYGKMYFLLGALDGAIQAGELEIAKTIAEAARDSAPSPQVANARVKPLERKLK